MDDSSVFTTKLLSKERRKAMETNALFLSLCTAVCAQRVTILQMLEPFVEEHITCGLGGTLHVGLLLLLIEKYDM